MLSEYDPDPSVMVPLLAESDGLHAQLPPHVRTVTISQSELPNATHLSDTGLDETVRAGHGLHVKPSPL